MARYRKSVSYVLSIDAWDWRYSLQLKDGDTKGAVDEDRSLVIKGALRSPVISKAKRVEVWLSAMPELSYRASAKGTVDRIGLIWLQEDTIKVYTAIKMDVLPCVLTMLAADRFKTVVISGTSSLIYDEGGVHGLRFSQDAPEEFYVVRGLQEPAARPSSTAAAVPKTYTPRTLAERWQCSERHVRNMVKRGDITAFSFGGKLTRITVADVEAYERSGGGILAPQPEPTPPATPKPRAARPDVRRS